MKVKWSVIVLVMLAVAAALAAAVLTASLSSGQLRAATDFSAPEIEILVASDPIESMEIVDESLIATKKVSQDDAPYGYMTEETQLIGKRPMEPLVKGQAFTAQLFPAPGTGADLASKLPPGKRAVNISLSDYEGLDGLLYPGCVVDVMAEFKVRVNSKKGTAVATTLLQNIEVLAVENITVGAIQEETDSNPNRMNGVPKRPLVTLLVDPKQAEALQLAMKHGSISLALRNPSDDEILDHLPTVLHDGGLVALAELLGPTVMSADGEGRLTLAKSGNVLEDAAPLKRAVAPPKPRMHNVVVMRGVTSVDVPLPLDKT